MIRGSANFGVNDNAEYADNEIEEGINEADLIAGVSGLELKRPEFLDNEREVIRRDQQQAYCPPENNQVFVMDCYNNSSTIGISSRNTEQMISATGQQNFQYYQRHEQIEYNNSPMVAGPGQQHPQFNNLQQEYTGTNFPYYHQQPRQLNTFSNGTAGYQNRNASAFQAFAENSYSQRELDYYNNFSAVNGDYTISNRLQPAPNNFECVQQQQKVRQPLASRILPQQQYNQVQQYSNKPSQDPRLRQKLQRSRMGSQRSESTGSSESASGGSFCQSEADKIEEEIEEEESENWEDEDDDDISDSEALILDLESNFQNLVDEKVADTESFFDNEQYIVNYVPSKTQTSKECCQCKQHSSSTELLPPAVGEEKEISHVECQTDEQIPETKSVAPINSEEGAREEVNHLRVAREALVNQRKEVSDLMKQNAKDDNSDSDSENERKLFGFEEAIDAVDSVIDYKNEVICGREFVMSNNLAPGKVEANLVARLSSLSTLDLQRLFCKFFSKVVEFRHSTKKLESQIQTLEIQHEQVNRRVRRYQNQLRDIEDDNADRIKEIIKHYSREPEIDLGEFLHYSKTARAARKKQQDLELSLTELLVRHCYLRDGDDYDVKQVVKMLGIDPLQLKLCQMEEDEEDRNAGLPMKRLMALGDVNPTQGLSRRMREVFNNRKGGSERPPTPAAAADEYRSPHHHSSTRRGHSSNSGHSSSAYKAKSLDHYHEYSDPDYSSKLFRQSTFPSTSSRHQVYDNHSHRHEESRRANGQSSHHYSEKDDAPYLVDKRSEYHRSGQSTSNQLLPAEVRRHDKKITIIPRQKHR